MTKRAVLYARVSGDDRKREDRNLDGQLALCRDYAGKRGYQIVAELAEDDCGASGAAFELPRLNEVREMAQTGLFDVLVTRELDRLSRNLAKQLFVEAELKHGGATIEYVLGEYPDTPEGNLMKNVRASVAEFERLKISERMNRGRELKVKAGSVLVYSRPPFGYRVVEQDHKWALEIDETEAQTVRLIFEWYTSGDGDGELLSIYAIQQKLNSLGLPSPADVRGGNIHKHRPHGQWSKATVGRLLQTETYAGTWHWRKFAKEKGKQVPRPEEEWVAVDVPRIVSRETWEAAVARRARNKAEARRNLKGQYLLRRRTVCGKCGSKMAAVTTQVSRKTLPGVRADRYYRCPAMGTIPSARPFNCDLPHFRVDQVDGTVWGWVRGLLTDPAALAAGLNALQDEQEQARQPIRNRLDVVDGLLADNEQQMKRLLDLYLVGKFQQSMLDERKGKLDQTIAGLRREREGLLARLEERTLTEEQVLGLQAFAAQVGEGLADADDDFEFRRFVVDTLDVTATLAVEGEEKVVYVRCVLGDEALSIESQTIHRRHPKRRRHPNRSRRGAAVPR
jgi:site-specific DNA recombinase